MLNPTAANFIHAVLDLHTKHGNDLAIVVNMSGGKDSVRMLGFIREYFPGITTHVVMADTGFEHEKPVSAEDWARQITASFGLPLHVVKNPNKTYLQMVENRKMFPSSATRQCTSDLKRGPIQKFIRHLPEKVIVIVNCMGIRGEESPARSKQTPWKLDAGMSKAGRIVWQAMPIFEETVTEVLAWHHTAGVPLHPVYLPEYHADGTKGGWLRRFSCRICIFSTDSDIRATYLNDRAAFDLVASLETRIGFTMKSGKSLFQILNQEAA